MTSTRQALPATSRVAPKHVNSDNQLVATVTDVTARLAARKVIGHAKGLLMANRQMTEPEAYRWIQKNAMDRRTPMVLVANQIVAGFADNGSDHDSIAS